MGGLHCGEFFKDVEGLGISARIHSLQSPACLPTCAIGPLSNIVDADDAFIHRGQAEYKAYERRRVVLDVERRGYRSARPVEVGEARIFLADDKGANIESVGLLGEDGPESTVSLGKRMKELRKDVPSVRIMLVYNLLISSNL